MGRRSRFESWRSRTSTSTRRTETGRPHSCSCRKKLEKAALRIMEAKDIDVNAKDKHGCTALMFACRHKLEKAALRILEFKDVNAKDSEERPPSCSRARQSLRRSRCEPWLRCTE